MSGMLLSPSTGKKNRFTGLTDTLLTVMRDQLLLTAASGCNQGVCGACTVRSTAAAAGMPVARCELRGRAITTLEGGDEVVAELQSRSGTGRVQCGFCTPGMIVSAQHMPKQNRSPIRTIRAGLCGNICRCTGYRKIVDAVAAAAAEIAP